MLETFTNTATHIYFACGPTDFRKQTESLSALVSAQFRLDPYAGDSVFVFCNKKRNAIKVLRYDHNGFILASKKLLDGMKFQWPRTPDEVKEVTPQQLKWLLDGLSIEQKKHIMTWKCQEKTVVISTIKSTKISTQSLIKSAFFKGLSVNARCICIYSK